jgi:hypothetical protein
VKPSDWSRNLRLGWERDESLFGTSMFAHPFHGGMGLPTGNVDDVIATVYSINLGFTLR